MVDIDALRHKTPRNTKLVFWINPRSFFANLIQDDIKLLMISLNCSHITQNAPINVLNWEILPSGNALAMLSKKTATNLATEFQLNVWKNAPAMTNVQLVNTACVHHSVHHPILKNAKFLELRIF